MSLQEIYGEYDRNLFNAETYPVARERVLGLQALLMTELRPIARTRRRQHKRPPKMTGFVLLQEGNHIDRNDDITIEEFREQIYDGSTDTYFGVMARQLSPRERRLTVSFLRYTMEGDNTSHRTVHQFLWRSDSSVALGSKREVIATSDRKLLTAMATDDGQLELIQEGDDGRIVLPATPTGSEFDELYSQVTQTIDDIKAA